jgi:hypothetical protein
MALADQPATVIGTVSILSTDSDGTKAEFDITYQEMIDTMMSSRLMTEPGGGDSEFGQFTAVLSLIDQLDLGIEFGVDDTGALTGVTNMDELATIVRKFIDSIMAFAAFSGGSPFDPDDREMLNSLLTALPDTETARFVSDAALDAASANLFLMSTGEYVLGQPVAIAGNVPAAFEFETDGHATYELTDISNGAATVRVEVSPVESDILTLVEQFAVEIAPLIGEDAIKVADGIAELESDERSIVGALSGILFNPYNVMLTIDTATGWVTAAEWSIEIALPESFEDLIPEEERNFDGFALFDFAMTMNMRSTF